MTDDMIALSRRAVACRGWRWMPGMCVVRDDGHSYVLVCEVSAGKVNPDWLPDLTDPATLGCLLALVREAWDDHRLTLFYHYSYSDWRLYTPRGAFLQSPNEAEALVAALETAP